MAKRDQAGNLLWVEWLWDHLPHRVRRWTGWLFPTHHVLIPREPDRYVWNGTEWLEEEEAIVRRTN